MSNNNNALTRFIGKIRSITRNRSDGQGTFQAVSLLVDNPFPQKPDGSPDTYHKGMLMWYDVQTQKYYTIKKMELTNCSAKDQQNSFINSVKIDLGSEYDVTPMS